MKKSCNESHAFFGFAEKFNKILEVPKSIEIQPSNRMWCCKNCTNRDREYVSETCEFCTLINKKVGKLCFCDFYSMEIFNK